MTDDILGDIVAEELEKAENYRQRQLTEARAQIALLRNALEPATTELNAIRARDGAPQHIDWYRGQPLQTDSCTHEWWNELTERCFTALAATPSDCYAQIRSKIRAEVLEDVAGHFGNDPQQQWSGFLVALEVRDMKDKP